MCRLSLAWVTSEKFHNATRIRHLETLLHWTLSCLPRLSARWSVCWLPLRLIHANCLCSCPTTNCLSLCRVVNSHSPPRTTSGYGEISCPRILCLVSRQNRQLNRLLWQPTPIVLQRYVSAEAHYVTAIPSKTKRTGGEVYGHLRGLWKKHKALRHIGRCNSFCKWTE